MMLGIFPFLGKCSPLPKHGSPWDSKNMLPPKMLRGSQQPCAQSHFCPSRKPSGLQEQLLGGVHLFVRQRSQVLAVHPRELGLVKDRSALGDAVQGELLLQLLRTEQLLRSI